MSDGTHQAKHERVLDVALRIRGTLLGGVVFAMVIGWWAWRIRKGIDLSDESSYIAIPLRFAAGDRPFLDERTSGQGAGILEVPFVALYHLLARGSGGVVLFLRFLYLAFLVGIGLTLFGAVRSWLSRPAALACGAAVCFYVPYCIWQLSYNTVGGGFAMLASIAALRLGMDGSITPGAAKRYCALAGASVACSTLAYPTMFPIAVFTLFSIVVFGSKPLGLGRTIGFYAAGGLGVVAYVGLFLIRSGIGSLKLTLDFIRAWGSNLTSDFQHALATIESFKADWFVAFVVAGGLTALARRYRPAVFLLALHVPLTLAQPSTITDHGASMRYFTCLGLFAPFFAALIEDRRGAFRVIGLLWAPGVIVGALASYSSGNGGHASGLGGYISMLATAVLAARACEEAWGRWRGTFGWTSIVAPCAIVLALWRLASVNTGVYRDAPLDQLTERVRIGPYRGLLTTAAHRTFVEQLHQDIRAHAAGSRYAFFFPDFPSAYLSADTRGAVPEIWLGPSTTRSAIDAAIFKERASEVAIVGTRACPGAHWTGCYSVPTTAVVPDLSKAYEIVVQRPDYSIYKRRPD